MTDILTFLDEVDGLNTPLFDSFIGDCFGEDGEARRGVLRIIAYCLLPDNPLQRYFFFEGVGGSGKGTLAGLIACMAGTRTTERLDIERMKSDAWLGPLEGKNVVIIDEAEEADPRSMRRVMREIARVTGSEIVSARSMYGDSRQIRSGWKFILIANEQPDSADKSGQQSRRVVPLYFGRKKEGGIIPLLHREIYRREGDKIFTKAVHEYALAGLAAGERLFEVDSPAFTEGKKRFEQSTGGIRGILKVFRPGAENMPKMFVEAISEIWIERKESRKFLHRALDKAVTTEMAVLGFRHKEQIRMPWKGPDGNGDRLSGFQECGVDTEFLLHELEMMPDELLSAVREKCGKRRKLWLASRAVLELPEKDFANAEGQTAGQQSFFE